LIIAAWLGYKVLRKLKISVDEKLVMLMTPWVIFGGILRVLRDLGVLTSYLFVTPSIWVFVFSSTFAILILSWFIEKKLGIPYFKIPFIVGVCLISLTLPFLQPVNWYGLFLILVWFTPLLLVLMFVKWSNANRGVTSIHLLDATTTFVAMQYFGYGEQHVVPALFIAALGPISFLPLKAIAILSFLLVVDKYCEDKELANYLKLIAAILGAVPATRDLLEVLTFAQLRA